MSAMVRKNVSRETFIIFMGDFIPQTPTAERGGADFWFMPRHAVPYSFMTDDRLDGFYDGGKPPYPHAPFLYGKC